MDDCQQGSQALCAAEERDAQLGSHEMAKIPEAKNFFSDDPQRANLIFPFFDQLINYGNRRYERGKHACQDPLITDRESCLQHWREASDIYRYVARYSPHKVITEKAVSQLSLITKKQTTALNSLFV